MNKRIRLTLSALLLVSAVVVLFSGFLSAQPQGRGPGGRQMMSVDDQLRFWEEELQLSAEQVTELKPILVESREAMMKIRERYMGQGPGGMREARPEIEKLNQETQAKIEPILSEEQMTRYREVQKERAERMRRRGPGGGN